MELIKVVPKGETLVRYLSDEEFFTFFHVRYTSSLLFKSEKSRFEVIKNCPYILRNRMTGSENLNLGKEYQKLILQGFVEDVSICWIDPILGYGLFAEKDLDAGVYIGEYTGLVRQLDRRVPDYNPYCFHYPTRFWSLCYYVIDALSNGNQFRFANHSDMPTMEPRCLVDGGLLHLVFFTNQKVRVGDELSFDYGRDFWQRREKK